MKKSLDQQQAEIRKFSTTAASDFTGMFKSMVMQGQSFDKAFQTMMDKMLDQFVDYVLDMTVKWVAEQVVQQAQTVATQTAITSAVAGGASANTGIWSTMVTAMITEWEILRAAITSNPYTAASEPAAAQATYTADSYTAGQTAGTMPVAGHALGGSVFADTPTLAMFGEGGPETATFTPMSGGGTSSGGAGPGSGGNSQVVNVEINIQGVVDQSLVNQIGQRIVQTIRGQGQIAFA